jgi:hypothetical protein
MTVVARKRPSPRIIDQPADVEPPLEAVVLSA